MIVFGCAVAHNLKARVTQALVLGSIYQGAIVGSTCLSHRHLKGQPPNV